MQDNLTLIDNTAELIKQADESSTKPPINPCPATDEEQILMEDETLDYEEGTKHEGWLHVRKGKQLLFVPKTKRSNGNGMSTTYSGEEFTIQEGPNTVKLTITFYRNNLDFKKLVSRMNKLVKKFQDMQLV